MARTDSVGRPEILALARAGATEAAWSLLARARGLSETELSALRGRLLKEKAARADGAARQVLLREAADAYAVAARVAPATYPLINAATLRFLSGDGAAACRLAAETLALLDSGAHEPDTRYWLGATRAEALLLLGRETEAKAALHAAVAETPLAWEDHAVTLRQFRRILDAQGRGHAWIDSLRPPPAVHFAGVIAIRAEDPAIRSSLDRALGTLSPGTATGALAAGFDIFAAEALLEHGFRLHVILPDTISAFVEASVAPFGTDWTARFDRILAEAVQCETLEPHGGLSEAAIHLAEEMALGVAVCEARSRDAEIILLRTSDSSPRQRRALADARPILIDAATLEGRHAARQLGPPERPGALVGYAGPAANLGVRESTGALNGGSIAGFGDLASAAEAAMILFERSPQESIVLDYGVFGAIDIANTAPIEAILSLPPRGYPIATRAVALALAAQGAPFRCAPTGGCISLAGSVDLFSLWRATPPDPPAVAVK